MLKRQFRLRDRRVFKVIYRQGQRSRSQHLAIYSRPNQQPHSRLAVVVSTKVSKRATVRNRIRRRLYGLMRANWPALRPGHDIVIVTHTDINHLGKATIEEELGSGLHQLGLLKG